MDQTFSSDLDAPRRSKRQRTKTREIYVPDTEFLSRKFFIKEEMDEDEKLTREYGSDTYIPSDALVDNDDDDDESSLLADLQEKGLNPDTYEGSDVEVDEDDSDPEAEFDLEESESESEDELEFADDDELTRSDYETDTTEVDDYQDQDRLGSIDSMGAHEME